MLHVFFIKAQGHGGPSTDNQGQSIGNRPLDGPNPPKNPMDSRMQATLEQIKKVVKKSLHNNYKIAKQRDKSYREKVTKLIS